MSDVPYGEPTAPPDSARDSMFEHAQEIYRVAG